MEVQHRAAAGALVQAIDVLRDELEQRADGLPRGERAMRAVR